MTAEEYLKARGWQVFQWAGTYPQPDWWTDGKIGVRAEQVTLAEAVAVQVQRDLACAEFVKAYLCAKDRAAFDRLWGDGDTEQKPGGE